MRVLVLGANGLVGHAIARELARAVDVCGTVRDPAWVGRLEPMVGGVRIVPGVTARAPRSLERAIRTARPDAVVNAVGLVKQRPEATDAVLMSTLNAELPHRLADLCAAADSRLVHISTDCVFSGRGGAYREKDVPDPIDPYGRSKLAGEVVRDGCVTVRTSVVGWQLSGSWSLLEWLAAHRAGRVQGRRRAVFSGPSSFELGRLVARIVERGGALEGLFHASADPISKHDLLAMVASRAGWKVTLEPTDEPRIDRSLVSERLRTLLGWTPPSWEQMVDELVRRRADYEVWRAGLGLARPDPARRSPDARSRTSASSPTTFFQS